MAFDLKYLQRSEITANLDKTTNPGSGMDTITKPVKWVYNALSGGADDTKAETVAADYFLGAYGYLSVGDSIYCACSNGAQELVVTASSSSTVTTSAGWSV